jgi:hypothetical protein
MFSTYSKGTNTQNFAKKTIKKLLQKNRKITKNLKCKMKKMTHPPINLLLQLPFMVRPPNKNKKLEMRNNNFFFVLQKHYET